MTLYKVLMIPARCAGCGLCTQIAPEIFAFRRGSRKARARRRFVPRSLRTLASAAARHCPHGAVVVFTLQPLVARSMRALTGERVRSYPR